jgi:hypothetical protein
MRPRRRRPFRAPATVHRREAGSKGLAFFVSAPVCYTPNRATPAKGRDKVSWHRTHALIAKAAILLVDLAFIGGGLEVEARVLAKGWLREFKTSKEALVCDLCKQCGTIRRVYVRNPNQDWVDS